MQVMPDTGRRYGVQEKELRQPRQNIRTGTRYLADLIRLFDGDLRLALAGYNAGENIILRSGRQIPPYAETQAYVPRVLRFYDQLTLPVKPVDRAPATRAFPDPLRASRNESVVRAAFRRRGITALPRTPSVATHPERPVRRLRWDG